MKILQVGISGIITYGILKLIKIEHWFSSAVIYLKVADKMANSVDPGQTDP